jgi:hypothetical protein
MYDIVFISYNEVQADTNWNSLKSRFPYAKRVHGVKGIHQAHVAAANKAFTDMIWIVDADAIVLDSFDFSYIPSVHNQNAVHVFTSRNPINDLEYGNGGIKLFPRLETINMDVNTTDMSTSISDKFISMPEISNITAFNVDEFSTWRSAFRECAKLSSKIIDRQNEDETNERLHIWTTMGMDRPFGEFAIKGAIAGREYGLSNGADLRLINDYNWIKDQYNIK